MLVRYDDPEFSKRYDLVVADGTDQTAAFQQVAAVAWNREYAVTPNAPLSKYLVTDAHIIRMAEVHGRLVKLTGS